MKTKEKEYTIQEMKTLLDNLSGMYDMSRIVDPIECRILELQNDTITMSESCYGIWNSNQRCVNCSSVVACKTGCHQEKAEFFQDQVYHIQSNPIKLKLPDGGLVNAVLELVSIEDDANNKYKDTINNREKENIDDMGLRYHEMYDELTGILKVDAFYEQARELINNSNETPLTIITGDIMDFRLFNNLFGVEKGNEALVKVASEMNAIAKKHSGVCCRLYRDKFALMIPTKGYLEKDLLNIASDIRTSLSNGIYTLCIHFGVYNLIEKNIPISVMCDRANMALKTIHRDINHVVAYFDNDIMERSILEQEIISGFNEALNNGSFKMYLQPLAKKDGIPFGAEALVRWIQPDGSVISPGIFIKTLEDAGLIHELDKNIWELAVKQLSKWKNTSKKDLTISVNMSAKDFYNLDIYGVLTGLTKKYGVENNKLRIEITESAIIEEPSRSFPIISKLQDAGFLIEIDDFGKGASSLSLLKDIKADILKIDMEFLRESENEKRSRIILEAIIGMANDLGMHVIAEGIETRKQIDLLSNMGCDSFQGYYFSRPISIDEFNTKYTYA